MSTGPTFTADPTPAQPPELRPLGVGETVDVAMKLFFRNFGTLVKIVLFVVVPIEVLGFLVRISTTPSGAFVNDGTLYIRSGTSQGSLVVGQIAVLILRLVVGLIATGAVFRALSEAYLGHGSVDWKASLRFGLRRAGPLVWLSILTGLGVLLATIALVIPGIWLYVAWSIAVPVLMVEDRRGSKALGRSFDLVRGNWWRTFGTLLLFGILVAVIFFVVGLVLGAILSSTSSVAVYALTNTLIDVLSSLIATPLQAAVLAVLYFNLRVRKEGFDLELLADRLGLAGPRSAAPAPTAQAGGSSVAPPEWNGPSSSGL